jgi:hypothetical protein
MVCSDVPPDVRPGRRHSLPDERFRLAAEAGPALPRGSGVEQ